MAKKRDFVGVYVTETRIEAAYFEDEDDEQPALTAQGSIDVPDGLFNEDGDIAEPEQLADLLKELWEEAGFKVWKCVIVLASRKAIVRQLKLPHMAEEALQQTVLSEAEQFALFRKEEPLVHFFVSDPEGEFIQLCFGAISSEVVKQYNQVCKLAGLKLVSVDLVQLAGQRGIAYWNPVVEGEYWTGVMVLNQRLIVTYWRDGRLQNIREILLPDRERISVELIAQNYIPEITRTIATDADFFDDPHLVVGCEEISDARDLAANIQSYYNFPARVAGPDEFADQEPVRRKKRARDEDAEDEDDDEDDGEALPIQISYITVGAALWGEKGAVPSFNLTKFASRGAISGPFKVAHLQRMFANVPPLPVAAVALAFLLAIGGTFGWKMFSEKQIDDLNKQIAQVKNDAQNSQASVDKIKPEATILKQWTQYAPENQFAEDFVGKLRDIIPADTWIYSIEYTAGDEIAIDGASLHQNSPLQFADELSSLPKIDNPKVRQVTKFGPFFKFEIHATLLQSNQLAPGAGAL